MLRSSVRVGASLLSVCGLLGTLAPAASAQCQIQKLAPADGEPGDTFGNEVSIFGSYAIVGVPYEDDVASAAGAAYFFERIGGVWTQVAKLYASDAEEMDRFGWSVAIGDGIAVVGSRYDQDLGYGTGAIYIYERIGGVWSETAKLLAEDLKPNTLFGHSVGISGSLVVVGANVDDSTVLNSGSAYVYEKLPGGWAQTQKLVASDAQPDDRFGFDVSIDGDVIGVGAYASDPLGPQSGAAYVYERVGGVWTEVIKLVASDGQADQRFGADVDVSGDTIVVGAPNDDVVGSASGSAYVFEKAAGSWVETKKLLSSDQEEGDFFGDSVSIDGGRILVGAWSAAVGDAFGSGAAYLFEKELGVWTEQGIYQPDDPEIADNFGFSVDISGGVGLVASRFDDEHGTNSGSVYLMSMVKTARLASTSNSISVGVGGSQELALETCPAQEGRVFFVLGSLSGTAPGVALDGQVLPVNFDFYTALTLGAPNLYPLANSFGVLGADGMAVTSFSLNAGTTPPALTGTVVSHAAAVLDPTTLQVLLTSAAVQVVLVP